MVEYGHRPFSRLRFYKERLMECLTGACAIGYAFVKVPNSSPVRNDTVILKASLEDRNLKHLDTSNMSIFFAIWSGRAEYRSFAANSRISAGV